MKKIHLLLLGLTICLFSACHNDIWEAIDGLDSRVTKLEELCKEMNTNITSLQTIVDVLQSNDFITGVVEIKKDGEVIGYTITFGKHDPITIYHGQDGKDGADGKDGQDGQNGSANTPVIGVSQDTDGVYYWTLNGEWLLDDNGNKLPVSGKDGQNGTNGSNGQDGADGKDGQDGEDGKDGADGQDGKDGITPQLKIEEGYWYISYDNGVTWTQLGKATGEDGKDGVDGVDGKDGQNGADGKDGQDGDSMFQSVTQDENYVYFTLADGTVIKIAKGSSNDQPNSEFIFTITYDANGANGEMQLDTFYYGQAQKIEYCTYTKQGYHCTHWNTNAYGKGVSYKQGEQLSISKNIVLYAQWDYSDFSVSDSISVIFSPGNLQYQSSTQTWRFARTQYESFQKNTSSGWRDIFSWSSEKNPGGLNESSSNSPFIDWGSYQIGTFAPNTWRTLTADEWNYLMNIRPNAKNLRVLTEIEGKNGYIILPDNWDKPLPDGYLSLLKNDAALWLTLENAGAVFIPECGSGDSDYIYDYKIHYWSATKTDSYAANYIDLEYHTNLATIREASTQGWKGVRLVQNVK